MHKTSKERRQIVIEKGVKIEMALKSASKLPSEIAKWHLWHRPYKSQRLSDQTKARIGEQRKTRG